MPIAEVSVVPIGTASTGISELVADAVRLVRTTGLKYEITAMGTIIEGELDDIFAVAEAMHQRCILSGAMRVMTTIRVDDRLDQTITIENKRATVIERLQGTEQ